MLEFFSVVNEKGEFTKVSMSKFAKLIGVSATAVSDAIKSGRMPDSITLLPNGQKSIDVQIGIREFNENKKKGATSFSTKESRAVADTSVAAQSEKKLKHYKAELARIEFEEAEKKLVNADKVKRHAFKIARSVRDAMLNIPDRISAELAAEKDQFTVHQRLTEEIRLALEALSQGAGQEYFEGEDKDEAVLPAES